MYSCKVCKCHGVNRGPGANSDSRQNISWKEARSLLKLGNPAEYYRSFKSIERRLCKSLKHHCRDKFVVVEIFSPEKDTPITLNGGAVIEFKDGNVASFKNVGCYYG